MIVSMSSRERSVSASIDDTLETISAYRTWTRVTREPIKGASLSELKIQNRPPINLLPTEPQQITLGEGDIGG